MAAERLSRRRKTEKINGGTKNVERRTSGASRSALETEMV